MLKAKSGSVESARKSPHVWGNRVWYAIVYSIIIESWDGALKTHLMNRCNLNFSQVQNYLDLLLHNKLLMQEQSYDSRRTIYKTTELGRKYAEIYKQMLGFFL